MKKEEDFLTTYKFPLYIFSGILIYITFVLFNKAFINGR